MESITELYIYLRIYPRFFVLNLGLVILFLIIPVLVRPDELYHFIDGALIYSALITPFALYLEFKRQGAIPFFDNLRIPLALVLMIFSTTNFVVLLIKGYL